MIYALLATIGVVAGVLSGMFGIGGGVLIVPALMFIVGFPREMAMGTSLAVLVTPVRLPGVIVYLRRGLVDFRAAACVAAGFVLTSGLGGMLSTHLDEWLARWIVAMWQVDAGVAETIGQSLMRRFYGVFLLFVAWRFIQPIQRWRIWTGKGGNWTSLATADDCPIQHNPGTMIRCGVVGIVAGFTSGLFGISGGVVIVPLLTWACHISPKRAVATSLASILLPVALPAAMVYYNEGCINMGYAAALAGGLLVGTAFGAKMTVKLKPETVKELFGFLTLAIALKYLISG